MNLPETCSDLMYHQLNLGSVKFRNIVVSLNFQNPDPLQQLYSPLSKETYIQAFGEEECDELLGTTPPR